SNLHDAVEKLEAKVGIDSSAETSSVDYKLQPGGMTGATQLTRYVGATTSGSPSTGAFNVGDFVVARDGRIYVCTSAGTPGTWVDVGAARSLVDGGSASTSGSEVIDGGAAS
ncbi:MAG TPA: hypothetical protein VD926_05795, partial [Acidimicrobiales bacterium]|nr:hypothetical protein [Acidimicrobiales bacterium]